MARRVINTNRLAEFYLNQGNIERVINTNRLAEFYLNQGNIERAIKSHVKKENGIIYGARAIQKQIPLFARSTEDYDVFVKNPKNSANKIEKKIERLTTGDDFFVKKGVNPGTWKVKHKGRDFKSETADDISVIDLTKMPSPEPRVRRFNGIKYRDIRQELIIKRKILRDKQFAFRHKKDREDLDRINLIRRFI